jgi:hypothetical protein
MRLLPTKSQPRGRLDTIGDSLSALTGGVNRNKLKLGLIAGGVAALTAGSAVISSTRRRVAETDS